MFCAMITFLVVYEYNKTEVTYLTETEHYINANIQISYNKTQPLYQNSITKPTTSNTQTLNPQHLTITTKSYYF